MSVAQEICGRGPQVVLLGVAAARRMARTYTARVAAAPPAGDYTPRVSPKVDAAVPLEAGRILWQR